MARAVVQIAPSIFRIPTLGDFINSYAFIDDDGQVALVDCGLKRAPAKIVRGLAALGKHPRDVTRIFLTHAHNDHAGGAAELLASSSSPSILAHHHDATFLRTGTPPPRDTSGGLGRLLHRLPGGSFSPVEGVEELRDGQILDFAGGLEVVHTPGHTPGHISLLHPGSKTLITGDSIFNINARMTWPLAAFCTSFSQTKLTANVLADLDYRTAAFTHGPEIRETGREAIRSFLTRKAA
jgi:glyoxylase-like metal-dependent hydrolase (beta-lactamase superfamily II)